MREMSVELCHAISFEAQTRPFNTFRRPSCAFVTVAELESSIAPLGRDDHRARAPANPAPHHSAGWSDSEESVCVWPGGRRDGPGGPARLWNPLSRREKGTLPNHTTQTPKHAPRLREDPWDGVGRVVLSHARAGRALTNQSQILSSTLGRSSIT